MRRLLSVLVPLALAAAPQTVLLIDDHDVLYRSGTRRILHPAARYSANPVLTETKPWELAIGWTSVHRDPASGKYQMWYQAYSKPAARLHTHESVVCYAESRDGLQWTKPNLGLFDFNGERNTNIVMIGNGGHGTRYANSVVYDPRETNPARRYKMIFYDWFRQGAREYPGLHTAFSPDGIHWTKSPGGPLLKTLYGGAGQQPPYTDEDPIGKESGRNGREVPNWRYPLVMSDGADLMWDPVRAIWAVYGKMWFDRPDGALVFKHGMGRAESKDLTHWSNPELLLTPDDQDPSDVEFHTTPVFHYKNRYFCLNQVLRREGEAANLMIDIELMISRDGKQWERPFRRDFFLPRNPAGGFDGGSMFTNANPIVLDREIRFYYGGYPGTAVGGPRSGPPSDAYGDTGVGMASIPLDRFAGIRNVERSEQRSLAGVIENRGQITMRARDLTGTRALKLNAATDPNGWIKLELLSPQGYREHGYTLDEAIELKGDSFAHQAAWKGKTTLPPGRHLIRIHLYRAEVFSLTFE